MKYILIYLFHSMNKKITRVQADSHNMYTATQTSSSAPQTADRVITAGGPGHKVL